MSVTGLGRIAMAEKMSVAQLQEALQNKTLPAYIAAPLLEEKLDMQDRMQKSAMMRQQAQQQAQPPIVDRVMQRAAMASGIDTLPSNLAPTREYAGGGIVAFDEGGEVPRFKGGNLIDEEFRNPAKVNQTRLKILRDELVEEQRKLTTTQDPSEKARIQANITAINNQINYLAKAPSPETNLKGFATQLSPDDPKAKALQDQRRARVGEDAGLQPPLTIPPGQAAPAMNPQQMVEQARGITDLIYPQTSAPKEMTPEQAFEQSDTFMTMAGVDRDIFKKQGKELAEERAGMAKDKEEAKTFRILQAAAGILGGTSPFASVNIGKGLDPAIQGLGSDIKEFQKNERALRAAERDLAMSEQKFNLTRASSAEAQMIRSQDRVDKHVKDRAGLLADISKSYISVAGQKEVAETQVRGYKELQKMRDDAPPDVVKLADRLKKDMPNSTELERLEIAANLTNKGLSAIIGAESKAAQVVEETFNNRLLMNKDLKKINEKAEAGDLDAKRQIKEYKDNILREYYNRMPTLSSRRSGETETPQTEAAPPRPATLPPNAPAGSVFGNYVPGMGWEIKDKSGTLLGYGQ